MRLVIRRKITIIRKMLTKSFKVSLKSQKRRLILFNLNLQMKELYPGFKMTTNHQDIIHQVQYLIRDLLKEQYQQQEFIKQKKSPSLMMIAATQMRMNKRYLMRKILRMSKSLQRLTQVEITVKTWTKLKRIGTKFLKSIKVPKK